MKKLLFILVTFMSYSCSDHGLDMVVHNMAEEPIYDIIISTDDTLASVSIQELLVGKSEKRFLNMEDVEMRDGCYLIEYTIGGRRVEKDFGYYTNGYSPENRIDISVFQDSIIYDGRIGLF